MLMQALVCRSIMSLSTQDAKRPGNKFMLFNLVFPQDVDIIVEIELTI